MHHLISNEWHEVIRFDPDEDVIAGLLDVVRARKINAGWVSALGACRFVELGFYDLEGKKYLRQKFTEPLEVASLTGNIAWLDQEPILHLHGSFGRRDFSTVSGHVHQLIAHATLEVFLHKVEGTLNRYVDPPSGLKLLK